MAEYFGNDRHVWAWGVGLVFAMLACIQSSISIFLTYRHTSPRAPRIRRYVVQVLFMVPVYAIEGWLGLVLKNQTQYFDVLRECYEAFAIWSFYMFLVSYLGGQVHLATLMKTKKQEKHKWPFNHIFSPWDMQTEFYKKTKRGTLQYVPIKIFMAIVTFVFTNVNDSSGNALYIDGDFSPTNFYPWVAFITNASQLVAMYCLILFYVSTKPELKYINPLPKFLCIKAVVFFTFWQSVLVSFLVYIQAITATTTYTQDQAADGLQDFLICIEMFFGAVAHWYAFPYLEFADYERPQYLDTLDTDVMADAMQTNYVDLPSPDADDFRVEAARTTVVRKTTSGKKPDPIPIENEDAPPGGVVAVATTVQQP